MKRWEVKTTKLNFFPIYFVQINEEIHFSFKNSEKIVDTSIKKGASQL